VSSADPVTSVDPWAEMVGQDEARARLEIAARSPVHAYLFLGTRGSGTFRAALGFAGLVLAAGLGPEAAAEAVDRAVSLAVGGRHPDVVVVEPQGASLRVSEAEEIIRAGLRTPVEGKRKVIVVTGVEVLEEAAIGKLLKVIEEPPPSTVFVLLAEEVPPEMVTIASRCVTVEFGPLSVSELERALEEAGVDRERAEVAAAAAGGDLDRARLLATDDELAARAERWRRVPERLDGSGYLVAELVDELRSGMDQAQGPLEERQQGELEELEARVEQLGERGSGRTELVARHKREIRRLRSDELRFGLATLARVYRDRLVAGCGTGPTAAPARGDDERSFEALAAIQETAENLVRNPNEALLLQHLFLRLPPSDG
jgi:DNA polymerase-3 subunit delta'